MGHPLAQLRFQRLSSSISTSLYGREFKLSVALQLQLASVPPLSTETIDIITREHLTFGLQNPPKRQRISPSHSDNLVTFGDPEPEPIATIDLSPKRHLELNRRIQAHSSIFNTTTQHRA